MYVCVCLHLDRIPEGKPPRFPKKPTIKQKGELLVMECILEAQPLPEITWWQGTKQITQSDRIKMSRKETGKDTYMLSLEISSPVIGDGGSWRCNAVNACGESNANISLNFQGIQNISTISTAKEKKKKTSKSKTKIKEQKNKKFTNFKRGNVKTVSIPRLHHHHSFRVAFY